MFTQRLLQLPRPADLIEMLFVRSPRSLQVSLDLGSKDNLGLVIRGGLEYGLGIFVTGVDDGSIASHHGIQVGMCKSGVPLASRD